MLDRVVQCRQPFRLRRGIDENSDLSIRRNPADGNTLGAADIDAVCAIAMIANANAAIREEPVTKGAQQLLARCLLIFVLNFK